jgi:hypothetical protein
MESIRSAAGDLSDEALSELETLDQEFFSCPHNLTDLPFAHVNAHAEEFGTLPTPDDAHPSLFGLVNDELIGS